LKSCKFANVCRHFHTPYSQESKLTPTSKKHVSESFHHAGIPRQGRGVRKTDNPIWRELIDFFVRQGVRNCFIFRYETTHTLFTYVEVDDETAGPP